MPAPRRNDPNGPLEFPAGQLYHLFYQYNPSSPKWVRARRWWLRACPCSQPACARGCGPVPNLCPTSAFTTRRRPRTALLP